jgi:tRNA U34 5-carboxymethylaminomethyl modifying enzyme MnmG/GidA
MCRKRTLRENSSMGQGVRSQRKIATRLAYKACFRGSVESNMDLALGQRCRDEMRLATHKETPFNVFFTSPEKASSDSFFTFREYEKT